MLQSVERGGEGEGGEIVGDGRLLQEGGGLARGDNKYFIPSEQLCTGEITSKQFPDTLQLRVLHLSQHWRYINTPDLLSGCT